MLKRWDKHNALYAEKIQNVQLFVIRMSMKTQLMKLARSVTIFVVVAMYLMYLHLTFHRLTLAHSALVNPLFLLSTVRYLETALANQAFTSTRLLFLVSHVMQDARNASGLYTLNASLVHLL